MKTLQNNYTTPEQSQRLLDLGVPVKSADCYYMVISGKIDSQIEVICDLDTFRDNCEYLRDYFPCWSVGRLMEIYCLCSCVSVPYIYYNIDVTHIDIDNDTFINQLINNIKESIEENDFDLSKLEE